MFGTSFSIVGLKNKNYVQENYLVFFYEQQLNSGHSRTSSYVVNKPKRIMPRIYMDRDRYNHVYDVYIVRIQ